MIWYVFVGLTGIGLAGSHRDHSRCLPFNQPTRAHLSAVVWVMCVRVEFVCVCGCWLVSKAVCMATHCILRLPISNLWGMRVVGWRAGIFTWGATFHVTESVA
jgi:hypothetical protein